MTLATTPVTTVLRPAAEGIVQKHRLAPRLASLQGTTLGLISNHKGYSDIYLEELGRLLQRNYGVSKIITFRKDSQSIPTPVEAMDDLATKCDAIINGAQD